MNLNENKGVLIGIGGTLVAVTTIILNLTGIIDWGIEKFKKEETNVVIYPTGEDDSNRQIVIEDMPDAEEADLEEVPEPVPQTKTTRLIDLEFFNASSSGGGFVVSSGEKDNLGNSYADALRQVYEYAGNAYNQYYINKEYTTFSGTVFLRNEHKTFDKQEIFFEVSGDNIPLYQYTFIAGVLPQEFSIDVTNVELLEIRAHCGYWDGFLAVGNPVLTYEPPAENTPE